MHPAPPRSIFPSILSHLLHLNNNVAPLSIPRQAMAMAMTEDYYAGDLDDVVHRLLPREILADVGVVVPGCGAPPSSCAVTRRRGDEHAAAVVEDLAAHLVCILGLDAAREHPRPHLHQHVREQRPHSWMGNGSRAPLGGGQYHGGVARHAPATSCWNGTAPRPPRFEMAAAVNSHPPARRHGTGTGVFLPRVEAYAQNRASSTSPSPSPMNGAKPPRMQRRDAAVIVAMRQQQMQLLQLRAMAAEMQRQKEAFAAAFQFQGCPAIASSQQWTY